MFAQFKQSLENLWKKLDGWMDTLVLALPNLVLALLVLALSWFLARLLKRVVGRLMSRATHNETVTGIAANVAVAVFMGVALFVVLGILQLDGAVTALLGTAGVVGLVVGLALQDPLSNIFSGLVMSVRGNYRVGDLVETNGYFGKIEKISLHWTLLLTPPGQEVVLPNRLVIQNALVNYSRSGRRRVDLECGVSYGDDLEEVKEIVLRALETSGLDAEEIKPVEVFFTEFGDSSVKFVLRFWQNGVGQRDYLAAKDKAIRALKKAFDEQGVTIPFPIRTLDFGIVGGVRLDDLYPKKLSVVKE